MPVSKEQLAAIIGGKARELCKPENSSARPRTNLNEGYDVDPSYYDADAEKFDAMYSSECETEFNARPTDTNDIPYTEASAKRSSLPDKLKESMLNNPIDVTGLSNMSVLDNMGIKPQATPKRQINEQRAAGYSAQPQSVDYSIIKAIVNECLNEHLKKQPLNEGATLQTIGLKGGTISLVDNKGNVYQAKLELIGNKNDKK